MKTKTTARVRNPDGTEQILVLEHDTATNGYIILEKQNEITIPTVEPKMIKIPAVRPLLKPKLPMKGRKLSLEHKQKIGAGIRRHYANKPKKVREYKFTEEHRRKIGDKSRKWWASLSPEERSRRGREANESKLARLRKRCK